jgi:hypothetical protein
VDLLIQNGQHNRIQFNNLSILPNAEMGDPEYQRRYGMVTVPSAIINIHGERIELEDDVPEIQDLVIATSSLPHADWRRVRGFCWMTALLHFDKIFQLPLIVAHEISGLAYRDMIEAFMNADSARYPVIGETRDFFEREAASIQKGGAEYVYSKEWLGIYWPADEYVFIKLTAERKFDGFYAEAAALLKAVLRAANPTLELAVIDDAVRFNHALVKQPFARDAVSVELDFDLAAFFDAVRNNEHPALNKAQTRIRIDRASECYDDFAAWCREVVWWGNKKGAYLYTQRAREKQLAGHF